VKIIFISHAQLGTRVKIVFISQAQLGTRVKTSLYPYCEFGTRVVFTTGGVLKFTRGGPGKPQNLHFFRRFEALINPSFGTRVRTPPPGGPKSSPNERFIGRLEFYWAQLGTRVGLIRAKSVLITSSTWDASENRFHITHSTWDASENHFHITS
jgi:hypothetical protein